MEPIPMKDGKLSAFIKTKWGNYTISSFKAVPGDAIEDCNPGFDVIHAYGGSLAKMHNLLEECPLKETRKDYKALMNEVLSNLKTYGFTEAVMNEFYEVSDILGTLPISDRNYGLVHYDFEVDNVFYNEECNSISVIDFDDCICCWFVLDVVRAIDSLREAVDEKMVDAYSKVFLDGYQEVRSLSKNDYEIMPLMRRFVRLQEYATIMRVLSDRIEEQPDWMKEIVNTLEIKAKLIENTLKQS